jgi:hypothetical protein
VDAAYYREWRRRHPEYRRRQNLLRKERLKRNGRGDRSQEYKKRYAKRLQATDESGWCLESSLIRKAKELALRVKQPDTRTVVYDDCYEDLVGECILALCEGRDPGAAMKAWMAERSKQARTWAPLVIR